MEYRIGATILNRNAAVDEASNPRLMHADGSPLSEAERAELVKERVAQAERQADRELDAYIGEHSPAWFIRKNDELRRDRKAAAPMEKE